MKRSEATDIARILDDIIRGRRGTSLFPSGTDGPPSNLGLMWIDELEKIDDASLATAAAVALFTDTTEPPTLVDYRAALRKIRTEKRMKAPALAQPEFKRDLPAWVKGKLAALAHGDYRAWPEQHPGYDELQLDNPSRRTYVWPDQEPMPDDERKRWEERGQGLDASAFVRLISHQRVI